MEKVRATQCRMERSIIGLRWDDKVTNSQVRLVTQVKGVGYKTKKLKSKFVGHVAREVREKWNQKNLNWRLYENIRNRGRPALKWSDELKQEFGFCGKGGLKIAEDGGPAWRYMPKMCKGVVASPAAPVFTLSK